MVNGCLRRLVSRATELVLLLRPGLALRGLDSARKSWMAKDAVHKLENGMSHVLHSLNPLHLRWSLVFIPWRITWYWVSLCLSFCLELCAYAGAPPSGYVTRNQVSLCLSIAKLLHCKVHSTHICLWCTAYQPKLGLTTPWHHRLSSCIQ